MKEKITKKKPGRKATGRARTKPFPVLLNEAELKEILDKVKKSGQTQREFLLSAVRNYKI
jgi:hypothetical protein